MAIWRKAYCPVCGLLHGRRVQRDSTRKHIISDENFWEKTLHYTGSKGFGAIFSSEGRGTLQKVREYSIDEDKENYFSLIKQRILNVLNEWLEKKWIEKKEIERILQKF